MARKRKSLQEAFDKEEIEVVETIESFSEEIYNPVSLIVDEEEEEKLIKNIPSKYHKFLKKGN